MSKLYLTLLFLMVNFSWGRCARVDHTETMYAFPVVLRTLSDSTQYQIPKDQNSEASLSLLSTILGSVSLIFGITNPLSSIGFIVVFGIFGLVALISGILGLKKRRKLIELKYRSRSDSDILPLGYTKSYMGVVLGSLLFTISTILLIAISLAF